MAKKDKGATKGNDDDVENLACQDSNDSDGMVLMDAFVDEHVDSKTWFLDTGSSNRMITRRVWLADFDESKSVVRRF